METLNECKFELKLISTPLGVYRTGYILKINKELAEFWGFPEKPVCQDCLSIIHNLPCYFCPDGKKLYCYDCSQSSKDWLCVYDRIKKDIHKHLLIVNIKIEGNENSN